MILGVFHQFTLGELFGWTVPAAVDIKGSADS